MLLVWLEKFDVPGDLFSPTPPLPLVEISGFASVGARVTPVNIDDRKVDLSIRVCYIFDFYCCRFFEFYAGDYSTAERRWSGIQTRVHNHSDVLSFEELDADRIVRAQSQRVHE